MQKDSTSFGDGGRYGSGRLPEPYQQTNLLYLQHFFFSFVSRMWDMGIVLLIAELTNNSLYFVALAGLFGSFGIFAFMSTIGQWLDKTDRLDAVKFALIVKISAVSTAYLTCAIFGSDEVKLIAYSLPILCAITAMSFKTITQSVEKDWLVVLSSGDGTWLSATNSVMTQIDLTCNTAAPAVTGIIFANFSKSHTAIILLLCNAVATAALWYFVNHLYSSWPSLGSKHAAYSTRLGRRTDIFVEDSSITATPSDAYSSITSKDTASTPYNPIGEGAAAVGSSGLKMRHDEVSTPHNEDESSLQSPAFFTPAGRAPKNDAKDEHESDTIKKLAQTLGEFYEEDEEDEEAQNPLRAPHSNSISLSAASPANKDIATSKGRAFIETNVKEERDENTAVQQIIPLHPYLEYIPGSRRAVNFYRQLFTGYNHFRASGCAGVMLAYAFLYFTVLSFGPLMTVYLRWAKVSDYWIGMSRGANALFGFAGASIFPYLKAKWGIWLAAQRSIWYFFFLVAFSSSVFFWGTQQQINVCIIFGVLFSRTGLWIFDLCARQIAQETIPEHLRGTVNGFWASIVAFFNMATFVVAIPFSDPKDFILLAGISGLVIFTAAVTHTVTQPKFYDADFREESSACIDSPARLLRLVFESFGDNASSSGNGNNVAFTRVSQDSQHGSV